MAKGQRLAVKPQRILSQRPYKLLYGHGLGLASGVSANCRRGNHATCYTVKCLCPCHNRVTGGVKPR